jgi:hypothetical protein
VGTSIFIEVLVVLDWMWPDGVLLAASVAEVLLAASVAEVLRAASVGRTLSPSASVVVLLKSDFLAYYC